MLKLVLFFCSYDLHCLRITGVYPGYRFQSGTG